MPGVSMLISIYPYCFMVEKNYALNFNILASIATTTVLTVINAAPEAELSKILSLYITPAARGNEIMLYRVATIKFCIIFLYVALPNNIKLTIPFGLLFTKIMLAVSAVISLPLLTAMLRLQWPNQGHHLRHPLSCQQTRPWFADL